ncbi:DUF362 domain-containing protein [bacterium]|nr:DUF362 domain-containing protein [bacterium]
MNEIHLKYPRVAVACGGTREEAVRNALALVRDDIRAKIKGHVIVKPNFLSSVTYLASTQAGAVRPVLELLGETETDSVIIAEGGSRSTRQAFERFGYHELARDFDVQLIDLNHKGFSHSLTLVTETRGTHDIAFSDSAAGADTVISVAVAKTHDAAAVTLSLKNMMGCLRRVQRPRMHGIQLGTFAEEVGEFLWNVIEDHSWIIKAISWFVFRVVHIKRSIEQMQTHGAMPGLLSQVRAMAENLVRLGEVLMPDIAVIDAFEAMEGEGPGDGTPVSMKIAVAGTDPVACDAVMASMMGFDIADIGYLTLAHERGLGVADLDKIEVVGEDIEKHSRRFKPHSNFPYQKRWREAWSK